MTKPTEIIHFNPPAQVKENWMLGLVDLETYNFFKYNRRKQQNESL